MNRTKQHHSTSHLFELWVRRVRLADFVVECGIGAVLDFDLIVQHNQDTRRLLLDQIQYVLVVNEVDLYKSTHTR